VACGPGIFMRYLRNRGFSNVVGIELDDFYIDICNAQGLNIIKADAIEWLSSQPAGSVDAIVGIDFIEHLDKGLFLRFLDAAHSALSPEGLFITRGISGDSPFFGLNFYNDITHETVFTKVALSSLMRMCGLELIKIVDEYPANVMTKDRFLKVGLNKFAKFVVRKLIYWTTGKHVTNMSDVVWILAKNGS